MFFRHEKPHVPTYDERMSAARSAGFEIHGSRASRDGLAAEVNAAGDSVQFGAVGVLIGNEIGELTDLGYQKVWMTSSGRRVAALAPQLNALHAFLEDLREALGITSLYNEGLGTVNEHHLYDRVVDRDFRREKRPWEISLR